MKDSQVNTLINAWMLGLKVDRVNAWYHYRIADLRSRVCDAQKVLGIRAERERKPGKRYLCYFLKPIPKM